MIQWHQLGLVWLAAIVLLDAAPARGTEVDFPPSPFSLPAASVPQSARLLRDADQALAWHLAATNAAGIQLQGEIRELKKKLTTLEAEAFQKDPLLLTCDRYIEKPHDWVMSRHAAEMKVAAQFFYATNPVSAGQLRNLQHDLSQLMELRLLKELGGDTNFAPLIQATFDNLEMIRQLNTNSAARPERQYYAYWQSDRLIGYHPASRPRLTNSLAAVLQEIDKREELLGAKMAKLQQEKDLPPAAVAGIRYGCLYRMLDGAAEMYLDCRTPGEVRQLREDLEHKISALSRVKESP